MSESEDSDNCTPPDILEAASKITMNLLPAKSRINYDKCYHEFMEWKYYFICSACDSLFPSLMALEHHKEEFQHWSDSSCCSHSESEDSDMELHDRHRLL